MIPSARGNGSSNQIFGLVHLAEFCRLKGRSMIEIGSFMGESTAVFARFASAVFAVDPWMDGFDTGDPVCFHVQAAEAEFDKVASRLPNIFKRKMTSLEFAGIAAPVHLVYIDGCHRYEAVAEDIRLWTSKVLPGGFLAGHDWQHEPVAMAVLDTMKRLPDKIFEDDSWIFQM